MDEPSNHPAASLFPMLAEPQLRELAEDIRQNGLKQSVVLHDGKVLDGRNRVRACGMAGVKPHFETWVGADPIAFVVSLNLRRRHLDESQRAMVAARIATMRQGARTDVVEISTRSQSQAGAMLAVSRDSVIQARKVLDRGAPELAAAVDAGRVAVSTASVLTGVPRNEQREIVAMGDREILRRAKEIRADKQEVRRQERVQQLVELSKASAPLVKARKYPLLYADPPWRYEHVETESRAIENQYPTMSLDEICALRVGDVVTADCVLFMWATSPKLSESILALSAWGFNYRTCAVWVKDKIGMGYYFRQRHELLLVATKGSPPVPAPSDRPDSVFEAVRGAHSAKPLEVYDAIERMYPTLPKLELFARAAREGWDSWGNQS